MKKFLIILITLVACFLEGSVTLKQRLLKATPGDWIVTAQGNNYSLLLIRALNNSLLTLEEVTIPSHSVDLKKISWRDWIENKAPGAISWITYTINLQNNNLKHCFSHLEKQWLFIDQSDYIFAKLLTLPLRPTKERERKKIGPPPLPGDTDRRKLWLPQLIREGKKVKKPRFKILRTKWPHDKSLLSGSVFELYLDADHATFPFPYWVEVYHPHLTLKIRTIDSGSKIISPAPLLQ